MGNHVLHKFLHFEICERQLPTQRRFEEGNEIQIGCVHFLYGVEVAKFEVFKILEGPNKIQDLTARAFGFCESKESKSRCEVPKALLDDWYEAGYIESIYLKLLEILECGEVTKLGSLEPFGRETVGVTDA